MYNVHGWFLTVSNALTFTILNAIYHYFVRSWALVNFHRAEQILLSIIGRDTSHKSYIMLNVIVVGNFLVSIFVIMCLAAFCGEQLSLKLGPSNHKALSVHVHIVFHFRLLQAFNMLWKRLTIKSLRIFFFFNPHYKLESAFLHTCT